MTLRKLTFLAALWCIAGSALAMDPSLQPTTRPTREATKVMGEWKDTSEALRAVLPGPQAASDPEVRKQVAPVAIPLLRQSVVLADEIYQIDPPTRERSRKMHYHLIAIMAFLGDPDATAELDDARQSNRKDVALLGRHAWYLYQWWTNAEDKAKSAAILDELEQLAAASPQDDDLAMLLLQIREEGVAAESQGKRIESIIANHLQGPMAHHAITQFKAAEKRRALLGKPLVISGTTLDGKAFSSASLKGQSIIVHFGATWCGPWQQEHNALLQLMPGIDGRLAIITVLCDKQDDEVATYQQRHKEIPWPVLRDAKNPTGFAAVYGVEDLPTTMVIGADGVVQQVDVTPNQKLVQSLLAQIPPVPPVPPVPPAAPAPPAPPTTRPAP